MGFFGIKIHQYRMAIIVLSVAIFLGTLFFGLRPRDFRFTNGVHWLEDQRGIAFNKYGIAYTDSLSGINKGDFSEISEFSIEISLKPASDKLEEGFRFVISLHNGNDREQFLIGQWRSWIILMNGDDYSHKRRTKRISFDTSSQTPTQRLLTITTGKEGTKVYLDNRLVKARKDFTLRIPKGPETRLLLGNSVYGKHSWGGDIYGLAFYGYTLSPRDIESHALQWSHNKSFTFAEKANPFAFYLFEEKRGSLVLDHADHQNHIQIPERMRVLMKEILSVRGTSLKLDRHFLSDIIINLVGFIPLGFMIAAFLFQLGGFFQRQNFFMAIGICIFSSLIIEIAQAWLPSRSSQMLDLMLNTIGGICGATLFRFLEKAVGGGAK